jgi:hypothetical protein
MPDIFDSGALRRRLAVVSVLALLAAGAQAGVKEAASASPASALTAGAAAKPAPTGEAGAGTRAGAAARALTAARRSGHRTEILADRTEYSQTFADPGGSFTTVASALPRWVKRGPSWIAADATLVRAAGGAWAPRAAAGALALSGGGGRVLATARSGSGSLSVTWPGVLPVPDVSGAQAT